MRRDAQTNPEVRITMIITTTLQSVHASTYGRRRVFDCLRVARLKGLHGARGLVGHSTRARLARRAWCFECTHASHGTVLWTFSCLGGMVSGPLPTAARRLRYRSNAITRAHVRGAPLLRGRRLQISDNWQDSELAHRQLECRWWHNCV